MREALINPDALFLQHGNMQKGGKGLAEENPGQHDHGQGGCGCIKSFIPWLFPGPKVPCPSPQALANDFTWQGMQSEMSARSSHSIHTTILHLASANLNAQKNLEAYQIREICLLSQNPAFSTIESGISNCSLLPNDFAWHSTGLKPSQDQEKKSCKSCVSFHTLLRSVQEKWHTDLQEHPTSCKLWLTKQSSVLLLTTKIR